MKFIALRPEQISKLRTRGFHQRIDGIKDGYHLVRDISFHLFNSVDLRTGEVQVSPTPLYFTHQGKPCVPICVNF